VSTGNSAACLNSLPAEHPPGGRHRANSGLTRSLLPPRPHRAQAMATRALRAIEVPFDHPPTDVAAIEGRADANSPGLWYPQ